MKAPDKIYLVETTRIIDEWRRNPSQYAKNIEYIHKEALMEWATRMIRTIANEKDDFYAGKRVAFNQVIEKLNSL